MRFFFPLLLAASSSTIAMAEDVKGPPPLKQPEPWQDELVEWLRSKPNGYFSPKVQWQKTPELGNSYNMYAVEDIPKDETIMIIPQAALIKSNGTGSECVTIANMMQEYNKGKESEYYPYINYLFGGHEGGTSSGLLPTTWSEPAKQLLKTIVGDKLFPQNFEQGTVFEECEDQWSEDEIAKMDNETKQRYQDAYIFWLSRSWSDKMVPILDMINHRNGKWLNVESTTAHAGEDIRAYALRDISKGEQLHNTYNECLDHDCSFGRIMYDYVTQHILVEYGFVEALPRRWVFHVDTEGGNRWRDEFLIVEVDEDPEDSTKLTFDWHYDTPTEEQIEWIEEQLERLQKLDDVLKKGVEKLKSEHEKFTITEYHRAYKEALQLALDYQDDEVSEKTVVFDEYDEL